MIDWARVDWAELQRDGSAHPMMGPLTDEMFARWDAAVDALRRGDTVAFAHSVVTYPAEVSAVQAYGFVLAMSHVGAAIVADAIVRSCGYCCLPHLPEHARARVRPVLVDLHAPAGQPLRVVELPDDDQAADLLQLGGIVHAVIDRDPDATLNRAAAFMPPQTGPERAIRLLSGLVSMYCEAEVGAEARGNAQPAMPHDPYGPKETRR